MQTDFEGKNHARKYLGKEIPSLKKNLSWRLMLEENRPENILSPEVWENSYPTQMTISPSKVKWLAPY